MTDFAWSSVDWPAFLAFAAVSLLLIWGIAYNGAKGENYRMQMETRRAVPESHVRQSASCTVVLLVLTVVGCGLLMAGFELFYGWYMG